MAAPTIIKGRDLLLFNSDGHSYAYATNHTMTLTMETADISSKDHGQWGAVEASRLSWEITSENLYTTSDYDTLFAQMTAGTPITVRFGLKNTPADPDMCPADGNMALPYWTSQSTYYSGKALITSLVANAPNGENASYNITLSGVGSLKKITDSSNG